MTFGSTLVIVAWLVTSAGFAWYLRDFASYGSIYGALVDALVHRARRQSTGGVP